jgi:hypothetical protein
MESKGVYLNEIPQAGEITLLAAVVDKGIRPKRNGGSYLALRLADRSAELDAKVWDNSETVAQLFSTSDVVKVRGTVEHYNDRPQLIVSRIRRCEPQEYDPSDFYPASPRGPEEMFGELQSFAAMIRDDSLPQLIDSVVNDPSISGRLRTAPAALKNHHAFRSGLLQPLSLCAAWRLRSQRTTNFLAWCEQHGVSEITGIQPLHVAGYREVLRQEGYSVPTVIQRLAAVRQLFYWLVTGHILPGNPASSVRGPRYSVSRGATPGALRRPDEQLLQSIDIADPVGPAIGPFWR